MNNMYIFSIFIFITVILSYFLYTYYQRYKRVMAVLKSFMKKVRILDTKKEKADLLLQEAIGLLKRWEDHMDNPKRNWGVAVNSDTKLFLKNILKTHSNEHRIHT